MGCRPFRPKIASCRRRGQSFKLSFRNDAALQNMGMSNFPLRDLKVRAQLLKPSVRLGKAGATPEFLAGLNDALTRSQLVKVRFEGFKDERKTLARDLATKTDSLLVQQVGYTAVYFRAGGKESGAEINGDVKTDDSPDE